MNIYREAIYGENDLELSVSHVKLNFTTSTHRHDKDMSISVVRKNSNHFNALKKQSFFNCYSSQCSQPVEFDMKTTVLVGESTNEVRRLNSTFMNMADVRNHDRSACFCYGQIGVDDQLTQVNFNFLTSTPKAKTQSKHFHCNECPAAICAGTIRNLNFDDQKPKKKDAPRARVSTNKERLIDLDNRLAEGKKSLLLLNINDYLHKLLRKNNTHQHKNPTQMISSNKKKYLKLRLKQELNIDQQSMLQRQKTAATKKSEHRRKNRLNPSVKSNSNDIKFFDKNNNLVLDNTCDNNVHFNHRFTNQKFNQLGQLQIWYV